MILLNDNFATILVAVKEERKIYANIQTFVSFLLGANIGENRVFVHLYSGFAASAIESFADYLLESDERRMPSSGNQQGRLGIDLGKVSISDVFRIQKGILVFGIGTVRMHVQRTAHLRQYSYRHGHFVLFPSW